MKKKIIFGLMAVLVLAMAVYATTYRIDISGDIDTWIQNEATTTGKSADAVAQELLNEKANEVMRESVKNDFLKAVVICKENYDCMNEVISLVESDYKD